MNFCVCKCECMQLLSRFYNLCFSLWVYRQCAFVNVYLHVEIRVDVLLFHELLDLFTPFDQLSDFLGQDSHFQVGIGNLRNLLRLVHLLPWTQESEVLNFSLVTQTQSHFIWASYR